MKKKADMFTENNKGFSLVELIIVVAIMAILVGVVGTQVIPYIENSKKARDIQVFSGWNTAGMSAYSMNAGALDASTDYEILVTDSSVSCVNAGSEGADKLIETFCKLTGLEETGSSLISGKMSSKAGQGVKAVKIFIPAANSGDTIVTTMYENAAATTVATAFDSIENE